MEIIKQKLLLIIACGLIVLTGSVSAKDEYQTQAGFSYQEVDYGSGSTAEVLVGRFIYNFSPINYSKGPYLESDFLNRVLAIAGYVGTIDQKFGSFKLDGDVVGLAFSMASIETPFLFNVFYDKSDMNGASYNYDSETIGLQFGYYIDQATAVSLSIEETNSNYAGLGIPDSETRILSGIAKKVIDLNNGQYLNIEGEIVSVDYKGGDLTEIGVHGDYYLDKTLGIGGGVALSSGEDKDDDGMSVTIDVTKFFRKVFVVGARYTQYNSDGNNDNDWFIVTAAYRF